MHLLVYHLTGQNDDKDGHPSKKKKTKKHKCDDPVKKEPVTKLQATLNAIGKDSSITHWINRCLGVRCAYSLLEFI